MQKDKEQVRIEQEITQNRNQLIAEARKIREGRKTCYYEVMVSDELGSQVAHMTTNGFAV